MTDTIDVVKDSVRRDDFNLGGSGLGGVVYYSVLGGYDGHVPVLPLFPPLYWTKRRDLVLRGTVHAESMWASAMGIAITKMAAKGWDIESAIKGEAPNTTKRLHKLFHQAEFGKGWVHFLSKHLRDYLNTDNGAFIEIIRTSSSRGSRITGISHLDSYRCTRTNNPSIPVLYEDRMGRTHELKDYQVIDLCDMPDPSDDYNGVGYCAASRAYRAIAKLAAIEQYFLEKITGSHPNEMHFINNVTETKIRSALVTSDEEQKRRGTFVYKGVIVVAAMGDNQITGYRIPLAEIPDGFDRDGEFNKSLLTYADAIGIDVQDLQPLTGSSLGTSAQSQILDDKASGKGLVAWESQLEHQLNNKVTPENVTWAFMERDWRDKQAEITYKKTVSDMLVAASDPEKGYINSEQALQMAVDEEIVPREFLASDQTPDISLSDDEKPDEISESSVATEVRQERLGWPLKQ